MKNFNISFDGSMSHEEIANRMTQLVNGPNGQDWIPVIKNAVPICMGRTHNISSPTTTSPLLSLESAKHCDEKIGNFFDCMKEQQFLVYRMIYNIFVFWN